MSFITLQPVAGADDRTPAQPTALLLLTGRFRAFFATMRARRELKAMDDRQLRDVGIHRSDITIFTAMGRMGG
ncbi:DUF1127 domain-containing protein [Azospirillum sp. TSO22-1]|uniref:DUF1127 domain-containing protein n=1 Tax=Azospirillum sp. TSO22-1 TaxID=716789 RepID=UPI000D608CD7|nr:DUF1127 domain-containing protein [Azospirillum sp. TSO22-1]PWC53262.1 hypothetical protein TSO221_11325 [Azospirillum sp. TSO22-1]